MKIRRFAIALCAATSALTLAFVSNG